MKFPHFTRYIKKVEIELEQHLKSGSKEEFVPKTPEPSLAWCLIKIFSGKFLAGSFLKLIQDSNNAAFSNSTFLYSFKNLNFNISFKKY